MRDKRLDGLKFLLIILVVFAHIPYQGGGNLYRLIYAFHMPLFIAVSGYCTSIKASLLELWASIRRIIKIFIIFTLLYLAIDYREGKVDAEYWITPVLWYLECLVFWRIATSFLTRIFELCSWNAVILSFVVGFGIGFVPFDLFAFQRLFAFYPFFLLGYFYRNKPEKFASINRLTAKWLWGGALLVGLAMAYFSPSSFIPKYHYTGMNAIVGFPYKCISALLISVALMKLIYNKLGFLSGGGAYSLQIYVLHPMVLKVLYMVGNNFNIQLTFLVAVLYCFVTITIILILSRLKIFKIFF